MTTAEVTAKLERLRTIAAAHGLDLGKDGVSSALLAAYDAGSHDAIQNALAAIAQVQGSVVPAGRLRKVRGKYGRDGVFRECGEPDDPRPWIVPQCMGRAAAGPHSCTCRVFYVPRPGGDAGR